MEGMMKRAKHEGILLIVGLMASAAGLDAQHVGPGGFVGLSFVAANPVGEMGTLVDNGFGMEVSGGAPMAAGGHLRARVDLGVIIYGMEQTFYCDFTCRFGSDVTTTNSILYASVGPEIVLARGDIEPYVHAGAGLSFFVTSSHMDDYAGYGPNLDTTNYSDTVFGWRYGGGLRMRAGGRAFIDVGVEKVDNQVANYLTQGDVVDQPDGSVLLYPNRSDADLMSFRVGVIFALR
jgi:hypothetical protein